MRGPALYVAVEGVAFIDAPFGRVVDGAGGAVEEAVGIVRCGGNRGEDVVGRGGGGGGGGGGRGGGGGGWFGIGFGEIAGGGIGGEEGGCALVKGFHCIDV